MNEAASATAGRVARQVGQYSATDGNRHLGNSRALSRPEDAGQFGFRNPLLFDKPVECQTEADGWQLSGIADQQTTRLLRKMEQDAVEGRKVKHRRLVDDNDRMAAEFDPPIRHALQPGRDRLRVLAGRLGNSLSCPSGYGELIDCHSKIARSGVDRFQRRGLAHTAPPTNNEKRWPIAS